MPDHRATSRSRRSRRRGPLRVIAGLLGLLLVLALAVLLFGTAGVFAPLRSALIERVLGAALGLPVEIEGGADIEFGPTLVVSGARVRIERPEGASSGEADLIEHGMIGLDPHALLRGRLDLRSLQLSGVSVARNSTLVGFDPTKPNVGRWFGLVPAMVRIARGADIDVSDVSYRYRNEAGGWEFDIAASRIATSRDGSGDTQLTVAGTVNGIAVDIAGNIRPLPDGGNGFTLTATAPGARLEAKSFVAAEAGAAPRGMDLSLDVASIGNMLEALKLARSLEGTAKLTATVETVEGRAAAHDVAATVAVDRGPTFLVAGAIADLDAQAGIDLTVDAEWPAPEPGEVDEAGLLAFELQTLSGRLTGDLRALALTDGWITTNRFSDAVPELGPISAGAIRRDDQGRIVVEDLHVLAGPEGNPTFDLKGRVGDLLQLADFRLAGDIAIPAADLLGLESDEAEAALGRLTGNFAVSDASGTAGIDTLTARLSGSDLVSAELRLAADQSHPTESATFALSFDIPDYARLAAAAKLRSEPIGRIGFKGDVALTPATGTVAGTLAFGDTTVTGNAAASLESGRPLIAGTLSTPALHLDDARRLAEIVLSIRQTQAHHQMSPHAAEYHTRARAAVVQPKFDFDVQAGRIDGTGAAVSGVSGRVLYDQGRATAQAMTLTFERGRFRFDGSLDTRSSSLPFSVQGRADNWPIGNVMGALGIDLPIQGLMAAAFDISSSAVSAQTALREARGSLYTRIVDGVIGNRLIDLSGLVLPSWLFAPSARTGVTHVDCFSAKLALAPGLATLQSAVVETDDVIVTATGRIDFRNDTIDIEAQPRARTPNLVPIVSPFAIRGSLSSPRVVVQGGGVVARGAAEVLALPFNTLGTLLGIDRTGPKPRRAVSEC